MTFYKKIFLGGGLLFFTIFGGALFSNQEGRIAAKVGISKQKEKKEKATQAPLEHSFLSFLQAELEIPFSGEDKMGFFFSKGDKKLPIVQTITFTKHAPFAKGRVACIADYVSYYQTSSDFIFRSLHNEVNGFQKKITPGSKFNVLLPEKEMEFHLVVDLSKARLLFYYLDKEENTKVLIKTYDVGVGKKNSLEPSGSLTPLGTYKIGRHVARYNPGIMGYVDGKKMEMMQAYGTRWIPFQKKTGGKKGRERILGIQGSRWILQEDGSCLEDVSYSKGYVTDGTISLFSADVEEIFSIITSRKSFVHIVQDLEIFEGRPAKK